MDFHRIGDVDSGFWRVLLVGAICGAFFMVVIIGIAFMVIR